MNTTTDAPVIELFASDLPVHCPYPSDDAAQPSARVHQTDSR